MHKYMTIVAAAALMLVCVSSARADTIIDLVEIGNVGNMGELSGTGAGGYGPDAIVGAVGYAYNMGKYEVTAGQYTEFLNAVAATDPFELYDDSVWSTPVGCKIQRTGSSGSYTYNVASDWAERPVNFVTWYDTLRFANWMHNGQPTGAQDATTTENGSYTLSLGSDVVRNPGATWVLPTENEWYKSAYHKNDGITGNYFDYPTSSDSVPSNNLDGSGNNGTFAIYPYDYTIGSPYHRTEVGAHVNSESPYHTFDQGGNVWEWNETILGSDPWDRVIHGLRGGCSRTYVGSLQAADRYDDPPMTGGTENVGFRVARVPEPATIALLAFGAVGVLGRRRP